MKNKSNQNIWRNISEDRHLCISRRENLKCDELEHVERMQGALKYLEVDNEVEVVRGREAKTCSWNSFEEYRINKPSKKFKNK